jgi:hypothetical protein
LSTLRGDRHAVHDRKIRFLAVTDLQDLASGGGPFGSLFNVRRKTCPIFCGTLPFSIYAAEDLMAVIVVEGRLTKTGESTMKHGDKTYSYLQFEAHDGAEVRVDKVMTTPEVDAIVDPGMQAKFIFTKYPLAKQKYLMGIESADGRAAIHAWARSKTKYLTLMSLGFGIGALIIILMCMTPLIIVGLPCGILLVIGFFVMFKDSTQLFDELGKLQTSRQTVEI